MKRLLVGCFALVVVHSPTNAFAQFTDPRAYVNPPAGTNQFELTYAYARANASIDTSLTITGAQVGLHQGTIDYTRYFGWVHRLTWVEVAVPIAGLSGSIAGTSIHGSVMAIGDSSYQLGTLLRGGPALSASEFVGDKPATIVGVSLSITSPTGSYDPNKVLNLGSDRWAFKPELAFTHPFGPKQRWELDAYANVSFYTDNASYHGKQVLRQEALPGFEGHVSYSFNDNVWASFDTRYSFRGATVLDGIAQNNPQHNLILGSEVNLSINPRNSLVFEFARAIVHQNGPALVGLSVKYDYTW